MTTISLSAKTLTRDLHGHWYNSYGFALCPCHEDKVPSLRIRDGDTVPLLKCMAGCDTRDIIKALIAQKLWICAEEKDDVPCNPPESRAPKVYWHTDDAPAETQRACKIWNECFELDGKYKKFSDTPAGKYLINRGIQPPFPITIAFGRLPHPDTGEIVPTLVAARHCPTVHLVRGIQRIFLTEDGHKYPHGTCKMSLGSICGGRSELMYPEDNLILAEGIETALSAWKMFDTPCWAMCGPFPSSIELPDRVRKILIVADADGNGCSQKKAHALAGNIRSTGREAWVCTPKKTGADANDLLQGIAA